MNFILLISYLFTFSSLTQQACIDPNCLTCNLDLVTCTSCTSSGYFLALAICAPCVLGCTQCTSLIQCSQCQNLYLLTTSSPFVCNLCPLSQLCSLNTVCSNGFYLNTACLTLSLKCQTTVCIPCGYGSLTCTSSTTSLQCQEGFYLNNALQQCQQCPLYSVSCLFNLTNLQSVLSCQANFYTIENYCAPCAQFGQICLNGIISECIEGYSILNGICTQCSPNISKCSNTSANGAISCMNKYYLQNQNCIACQSKCKSCESQTGLLICLTCSNGYYLVQQNNSSPTPCSNCLDINCITCSQTTALCITCLPEFFNQTNSCISCISNCLICMDGTTCAKCNLNYYYQAQSCVLSTIPNCAYSLNQISCTICSYGYYLNSSIQCALLPIGCSGLNATFQCLSCYVNYIILPGTSICSTSLNECENPLYYIDQKNVCQLLSIGCSTQSNPLTCLTCNQGYLIDNPNQSICTLGSICSNPYYEIDLKNNVCTLIPQFKIETLVEYQIQFTNLKFTFQLSQYLKIKQKSSYFCSNILIFIYDNNENQIIISGQQYQMIRFPNSQQCEVSIIGFPLTQKYKFYYQLIDNIPISFSPKFIEIEQWVYNDQTSLALNNSIPSVLANSISSIINTQNPIGSIFISVVKSIGVANLIGSAQLSGFLSVMNYQNPTQANNQLSMLNGLAFPNGSPNLQQKVLLQNNQIKSFQRILEQSENQQNQSQITNYQNALINIGFQSQCVNLNNYYNQFGISNLSILNIPNQLVIIILLSFVILINFIFKQITKKPEDKIHIEESKEIEIEEYHQYISQTLDNYQIVLQSRLFRKQYKSQLTIICLYIIYFCIDKNFLIVYLTLFINIRIPCFLDIPGILSFILSLLILSFVIITLIYKFFNETFMFKMLKDFKLKKQKKYEISFLDSLIKLADTPSSFLDDELIDFLKNKEYEKLILKIKSNDPFFEGEVNGKNIYQLYYGGFAQLIQVITIVIFFMLIEYPIVQICLIFLFQFSKLFAKFKLQILQRLIFKVLEILGFVLCSLAIFSAIINANNSQKSSSSNTPENTQNWISNGWIFTYIMMLYNFFCLFEFFILIFIGLGVYIKKKLDIRKMKKAQLQYQQQITKIKNFGESLEPSPINLKFTQKMDDDENDIQKSQSKSPNKRLNNSKILNIINSTSRNLKSKSFCIGDKDKDLPTLSKIEGKNDELLKGNISKPQNETQQINVVKFLENEMQKDLTESQICNQQILNDIFNYGENKKLEKNYKYLNDETEEKQQRIQAIHFETYREIKQRLKNRRTI